MIDTADFTPAVTHRRRSAAAGTALLGLVLCTALAAPLIARGDPFAISDTVLSPPSFTHPFGTDDVGRDVFRASVHGARASLLVGVAASLTALLVGVVVGGVAGFAGARTDATLMRLTEMFQVVPRFFLVLVVVALFGSHFWLTVLLLGLSYWPGTARLVRGQVLAVGALEHVQAARALGARPGRVFVRHVLPLALAPALTQASFHAGGATLAEAGLAFLGLGDPSVVSWGALLSSAQPFMRQAWWMAVFPGVFVTVTVLGWTLLADGLNEWR